DSISTELLAALAESGQKTITLAPETASEDMRKAIGKDIPQEVILDVIAASLKLGIIDIKLYFMVGLPYEKQDDIDNMIKFVELTRHVAFSYPRPKVSISPGISISISPFVPKPHTPFQWCQMESSKTLSQKLRFLRSRLIRLGGVKVSCSSAKWSIVQGILSRGDRRLGNVLYDISTKEVTWDKALKMNNLNQEIYLRKRKLEEIFSWDHLDIGMAKSSLIRSYIPIESFRN
ncbi:radical SAM protein, partial [Candidatus Poribacteria bacterium]|nr:radical SAM protein [Candidatus Poribacteria bacterium]